MDFISMTFEPTDRRPLYQQLYSWLAGEIAAGRLSLNSYVTASSWAVKWANPSR